MALTKLTRILRRRPDAMLVVAVAEDGPVAQARHMLDALVEEERGQPENRVWATGPTDFAAGRAILDSDQSLQPLIVCAAIERLTTRPRTGSYWREHYVTREVVATLCRRRLDYPVDELIRTPGVDLADGPHAETARPPVRRRA
jgi:hypothetical protein